MIPAAPLNNEAARLRSLHALDLLDSAPEERFDRVTRLACQLFGVPIALVSLVDAQRQWFKSRQGLAAEQTSREVSFCAHALHEAAPLVVEDARLDPRFADNPLVTGEPGIRFYAGCPLRAVDGARIGTLCVIDRRPRQVDAGQLRALVDLGAIVERELGIVDLALRDALTGLYNRRGLELLGAQLLDSAHQHGASLSLLLIDLNAFKAINDEQGHAAGDAVLRRVAATLTTRLMPPALAARLGGDEFVCLLPGQTLHGATTWSQALRADLGNDLGENPRPIDFSCGVAAALPGERAPLATLLARADARMYTDKRRAQ